MRDPASGASLVDRTWPYTRCIKIPRPSGLAGSSLASGTLIYRNFRNLDLRGSGSFFLAESGNRSGGPFCTIPAVRQVVGTSALGARDR